MSQLRIILIATCLFAAVASTQAQAPNNTESLNNTSWKAYYPPINDTVTMSLNNDTLTIMTTTGALVLQSTFKQSSKNLITFKDYGGMTGCPDLSGSYHVNLNGGYLSFTMDEDPCDGRGGSLIGKKWLPITYKDAGTEASVAVSE